MHACQSSNLLTRQQVGLATDDFDNETEHYNFPDSRRLALFVQLYLDASDANRNLGKR